MAAICGDRDVVAALAEFHEAPATAAQAGDYDDYAKPLLAFIDAHPRSNWNASLYLDIGLGFYRSGYYSRTFAYFEITDRPLSSLSRSPLFRIGISCKER